MQKIRSFVVCLLFAALAVSAHAATYLVPSDREMIQRSDDIVLATGVTSFTEATATGAIVTRYTLRIEEVLKGQRQPGQHLVLTEGGGKLGDVLTYIPGTPEYDPGERYLVFTEANRDLEPVTFGMALGQFKLEKRGGRALALRAEIHGFDGNLEAHREGARDVEGFKTYIRGIVAQRIAPEPTYFALLPENVAREGYDRWHVASQATRASYLMANGGNAFRWSTPTATFVKSMPSGVQTGINADAAINLSYTQWNGTASDIEYSGTQRDDTAVGGLKAGGSDNKHAILFNDPNGEVGSGIAGIGGVSRASGTHTLNGETFWTIREVDVVMNDGSFTQACFNTVMVHELGHTLGFRHSNDPPAGGESTTDAIMNSQVNCGWQGILKEYDKNAAATVYGSGAVCTAPSISTQPQNRNIAAGASTSLSVTAAGTSPFTYQWYVGTAGNVSTPVSGGTGTSINVTPTATTLYWVRVTNACGAIDSNAATVTVSSCTAPTISAQPQNRNIAAGASTSLSVTASGTAPLSYQWYVGTAGNVSSPVTGGATASITVTPSATTTYWVRVTNSCGTVDSAIGTVTVTVCPVVNITSASASPVTLGSSTLSVTASSPGQTLSYAWFRGSTPGTGGTQVANTSSFSVTVTEPASYWVRVTNACGQSAVSNLLTVAPCTLPSIATQPADQSIAANGTATLSLQLTGAATDTSITWYRGAVGDRSALVGNGPSVTVGPLSATTQYWAAVRNTCGEISSRQVTITVTTETCTAPAITTQPLSQSVTTGTVTLTVAATGTGTLQYQWYEGAAGDTTRPVGTNAASFTANGVGQATSYWVRVTNACGTVDSSVAQITVPKGRRRAVGHR
jgi:hypothetical protein